MRQIYWDDAHHLDHLPVLKAALRQAAFYKINGFVVKLEGHFQFASGPAVAEPYAATEIASLKPWKTRLFVRPISRPKTAVAD